MNDSGEPSFAGIWPITDHAISEVFNTLLRDGSWAHYHGPHCDRLRSALCQFHDVEHAVLCSSGTAAVELALRAVPVSHGDEVILCAYDFKANFVNVLTTGAIPVLIDSQPDSPIMDLNHLENACSNRTKAIVVSHLHGAMSSIQDVRDIADRRGIAVIEDACQSPGGLINGQRAGSRGHIGVLSFGGSKLLTSGRGGALVSDDSQMMQRIRLYTQRGNEAYPLSEMQAAVVLPQLRLLDARNDERLARVRQLCDHVSRHLDDWWTPVFNLPLAEQSTDCPVFYKTGLVLHRSASASQRNRFCQDARAAGIPIDPGFSALNLIHSAKRYRAVGTLQNARDLSDRLTALHHTGLLQPESRIDAMAETLIAMIKKLRSSI